MCSKNKYLTRVLAGIALTSLLFSGCQKKETQQEEVPVKMQTPSSEPEEETETAAEPSEPDTEPVPQGMVKSCLTGEYVSKEVGRRRPAAVMLNNIQAAVPQAGIEHAGVVYEAPVEGGITRLMGIFEDYDMLEKIGSVRSCRDYYIFFAMEFEAIYTHFGQAAYALPYLEKPEVNNLSGLSGYGDKVFYRTSDRVAPHNAYTSFAGIQKGIEINGYTQEHSADYAGPYTFAWVDRPVTLNNPKPAVLVKPHYVSNDPSFEYHEDDGLYYRSQYGAPQTDELTGNQLAYKNVILQYCPWEYYEDGGYLHIDVLAGGSGMYITGGEAIDITWKKDSEWGPTRYYDLDGNEITLNTGKTWVCIIQDTNAAEVEITGPDQENAESAQTIIE